MTCSFNARSSWWLLVSLSFFFSLFLSNSPYIYIDERFSPLYCFAFHLFDSHCHLTSLISAYINSKCIFICIRILKVLCSKQCRVTYVLKNIRHNASINFLKKYSISEIINKCMCVCVCVCFLHLYVCYLRINHIPLTLVRWLYQHVPAEHGQRPFSRVSRFRARQTKTFNKNRNYFLIKAKTMCIYKIN